MLARILVNPFYYGVMLFNGEHYEGCHPPLLSKALFDRVRETMAMRSKPQINGKLVFEGRITGMVM